MFFNKLRNIFFGVAALLASAQTHAQVVISQIYGGGGNSGATYLNDFVELHNTGASTVSLTNWTVQYASAVGTSWGTPATLSGSIPAGGYYLIKLSSGGAVGAALPAAEVTNTAINIATGAGKVALTNSTTALTGATPSSTAIQDLVGFGGTATAYETAATVAHSNTTALFRASNGCQDSNNNSADFSAATPSPRNSSSTAVSCSSNTIGAPSTPSNVTLANCTDVQSITVTGAISTGTYNSGNTYTAQVSDASGSFTSPLATASASSTSNTIPDITISIPAGTPTGTGYKVRIIASNPVVTGTASAAFTITQNGTCSSSATDYFRSRQTGSWATAGNWESSADGTNWITATLAPTSSANTINIQSGHNISITTSGVTFDQLTVDGTLTFNASTNTVTTADGAGTDLTINNGGVVEVAGSNVNNLTFTGTVQVNSGGILRYTSGGGSNIAPKLAGTSTNTNIIYANGAIFDWNNTSAFSSSGITYFSTSATADIPVFRVSQSVGTVGASSATIINGLLEVTSTGSISFNSSATKTCRNGISNAGTVTQTSTSGQIIISGTTAVLNGTGSILLATAGLNSSASTLTLGADKSIGNNGVTGTFTVSSGLFDMGSYSLAGAANFTLASGVTLKTAHVNGIGAVAMTGTKTFADGANYEFNGTSQQTVNNPAALTASVLTINNSAGVKLSNNITVTSNVALSAGSLDLSGYNLDLSTTK